MALRFISPLALFCSFFPLLNAQQVNEPRLSITQVGLHFICTADGQPDMYSWRLPVKDPDSSQPGDFMIPVIPDNELDANAEGTLPVVSGGRTALRVLENPSLGAFRIEHDFADGFDGSQARFTNLDEVHWRDENDPGATIGKIKKRYYSNYPPLRNPTQAGRYGTVSTAANPSSPSYGRYYSRHPGYDWHNWNWTLDYDTPLKVDQKRIQAVLHLELFHPVTTDLGKNFDLTLAISAGDLSGITVNNRAVFGTQREVLLRIQKNLFQTSDPSKVGGLVNRKLILGRRSPGRGNMPEDNGYDSVNARPGNFNMDLLSDFFTMHRYDRLSFFSGDITIRVFNTTDVLTGTGGAIPLQTIHFRLPEGEAPAPDLITTGSYWVNYALPNATTYNHPAVQAPRWWGFNRDGVLGRFDSFGRQIHSDLYPSLNSVRGRFYRWEGVSINSELSAVDSRSTDDDRQRLPGALALIYGYDAQLYPDLKQVYYTDLRRNPWLRIAYDAATNYNRPLHYGTDTVRTIVCIDQLEPQLTVTSNRFIAHPDYANDDVHLAYGRGFDRPVITAHPTHQTKGFAEPVSFSVSSTGTTVPAYQWFLNNQWIPGATQRVYSIPSTSAASRGFYHVVLTTEKGSVPSHPALLMVEEFNITSSPASQIVDAGGEVSFSVVAAGSPLKYQWRHDGLELPKAIGATLTLSGVKAADAGSYDVIVSGNYETEISAPATLMVNVPLAIVRQPLGGNLLLDGEFPLQVQAVGAYPLSYQWRRNGVPIESANGDRLVLSGVLRSAGTYDVVVNDPRGGVISNSVKVAVVSAPPVITVQPQTQAVQAGAEVHFEAVVIEIGVKYQWRKNGVNIPKANAGSLVLTNVQKKDEAAYDCVVKNAHGATLSVSARLSVGESLVFSASPADMTVVRGETAFFEAQVPGENVSYQWSFNGVPIPGAVYGTLSVPEADESEAGIYSITATKGTLKGATSALLKVIDKGALVYKLTGTGQIFAGSVALKVAFSGALIVHRGVASSQAALVLASKNGSQNVIQVQRLTNFRADSTGPAPRTQTVLSDVADGDDGTRSFLWMQGLDSLIVLGGADKTWTAKALSGNANRLEFDIFDGNPRVVVESIGFKGVLDIPGSLLSRRKAEDLNQAIERVSTDLLLKGYVEIPATAP